ncbi:MULTISPECIES: DUF805 domain-containing protein [unclassified Ligilactobacillus]|uniref:DUF805 domain-containing protein n=1 Tax=unclassified Ligilactobacillus TaxID=2767920 RepID=UPI003852F140
MFQNIFHVWTDAFRYILNWRNPVSRKKFWYTQLILLPIAIVFAIIKWFSWGHSSLLITVAMLIITVFFAANCLASLSLVARRLRDVGFSLNAVILFFCAMYLVRLFSGVVFTVIFILELVVLMFPTNKFRVAPQSIWTVICEPRDSHK